jgi:hypothetical protein
VVALDRKTRKTVERVAKELGKTVLMPADDFVRVEKPMQLALLKPLCSNSTPVSLEDKSARMCCATHYYRWHVNRIKAAAFKLYAHPEIKSIGVDTGTQLWEDILFAHYGRNERIMPRDRGPANQEMIDFLNCLSGKHLIITHRAREVWRNDKPTGRNELAGFPHMGYHLNVLAECVCDETVQPDANGSYTDRFQLNVSLCQDNPDIQGPNGKGLLVDDQINFQTLAYSIYPDVDPNQWE